MEMGSETLAFPTAAVAAEKTAPIGIAAGDDVTATATADGHPTKSYADVAAEKTIPNGSVAENEVTVTTAENPVKSYATVAAEKTVPDGSVAEDEVTVTASASASVNPTKSYAVIAAKAEIEDLSTTTRDLEELAAADHKKKGLAAKTNHLSGSFSQAEGNLVFLKAAASSSDAKVAALCEELKDLQYLLKAERGKDEANKSNSEQLDGKVESLRQVRPWLVEEVDAMKKRAAAAAAGPAVVDERVAASPPGAPQESRVAWPVIAGAAAVGAAAAAVALVTYLRLKR